MKTLSGQKVHWISPVGEENGYLAKSQALSSEWKTERVREDESGDSENSDDDELPRVIGDESEGDCVWRGSRRLLGS